MSDEDQTGDEGDGIKNLRKQYDSTKAERDQLAQRLAAFEAKERQSTVAELFKAKNIPISAAKLYTGEDVSEEAVGKWIDEYSDVFNVQPQSSANDANAQAAQRVSEASHGAPADEPGLQGGQVFGDPAEIQRALETLPFEELQKLGYMPASGQLYNQRR